MKIEVGVTHEIKIGRESAWIKLSITEDFPVDTDYDENIAFLTRIVNKKILYVIEDTVNTINEYTKDQ